MVHKTFLAADLFCGAGGTSTGLAQACADAGRRLKLVAVNHWSLAVESHAANHPAAGHHCEDVLAADPLKIVPGGRLDLLLASPECTHHSNARGGKPRSDQSRASAWCVNRWASALKIDRILVEYVVEFRDWGPLGGDGKPLKSGKGRTFSAWVRSVESLGYRSSVRVLNAADYGDATSRKRLFVQFVRGRQPIRWPDPSHARQADADLFGRLKPWRPARDVIDWGLPGDSIFSRKRPLSANTLRRIEAGLRKFGGAAAEPFLLLMNYLNEHGHDGRYTRGVGEPLPTVTAQGNRFYLCEPFITLLRGTSDEHISQHSAKSVDDAMPTITTSGAHIGLCEPFVVPTNYGEREGQSPRCHSVDAPLPTVVAGGVTHGIVEPFIACVAHGDGAERRVTSIGDPVPTQLTSKSHALVQPFMVQLTHGGRLHDCDKPTPTITTANRGETALVQPFVLPHRQFEGMQVDSVDQPLRTVTAVNGGCNAVVQPFIVPYYGTGVVDAVSEPTATVTAKDRLGLVQPDTALLDIRFRMLQPHELAAAMGFPAGYKLAGNRGDQVRQIGNAVPVNLARALCLAAMGGGGH